MAVTLIDLIEDAKAFAAADSFWAFHGDNPDVFRLFRKFAREALLRGHRRLSADAVLHRVRWETDIQTVSARGPKINNNHAAFYARLLEARSPGFQGFFRMRKSAADKIDFGGAV